MRWRRGIRAIEEYVIGTKEFSRLGDIDSEGEEGAG